MEIYNDDGTKTSPPVDWGFAKKIKIGKKSYRVHGSMNKVYVVLRTGDIRNHFKVIECISADHDDNCHSILLPEHYLIGTFTVHNYKEKTEYPALNDSKNIVNNKYVFATLENALEFCKQLNEKLRQDRNET